MRHIGILAVGAAAVLSGCCCETARRCGPPPCAPPPCGPAARVGLPPAAASVAAVPAAKPPVAAVPAAGPKTAVLRDEEVRKVLSEKKLRDAQFTDASLDDVVAYLRTITGLDFMISPKVRTAGLADVKISVPKVDKVSSTELLALVTAPSDLRWEVRDGVVWIVTSDEATSR